MTHPTVLLTGAAGGVGSATARLLAAKGWHVLAADVDDRALASLAGIDRLTPVHLDVTDQASISAAFDLVRDMTSGLDGLVNTAGVIALGSMIEMDESSLSYVLNVNALGCYRVNRTFFPLLLKQHGRIVNLSSEVGRQSGGPFNGAYAMSKHMVEAYSDSLRRELMFLGIPVIKIQPGPVNTGMVQQLGSTMDAAISASVYFGDVLTRMKPVVLKEHRRSHNPILIARVIHTALTAAHPRPSYSVKPAWQRVLLDRLPTRVADAIIKRVLSG